MQDEEPFEVHVAPVHDVEGAWLRQQDIEDVDVVQLAVGDMDESRDIAPQIQQGMEFDRRLGGAKPLCAQGKTERQRSMVEASSA